MTVRRAVGALLAVVAVVGAREAGAQPLGSFQWQLQPYCNVITVTVVQIGVGYTLDGTDNRCGAAEAAAVRGMAYLNPSGSIGFGMTIVEPGPVATHVNATITLPSLGGTWTDDRGHAGTFQYSPAAPAGSPRPSTAPMRISVGHSNWRPFNSADNLTFGYFSNRLTATRGAIGANFLSVSPSLPVSIDGRRLNLLGVELCYQANASATLASVNLNTTTHATNVTDVTSRATDSTVRTDEACRYYAVATTYTLGTTDAVNLFVNVNYLAAGATFRIGRTTFVVEPTTTPAPAPDTPAVVSEPVVTIGVRDAAREPPR